MKIKTLSFSILNTLLGKMTVIADEQLLYFLGFNEISLPADKITRFKYKNKFNLIFDESAVLLSVKNELEQYFDGKITSFKTPRAFSGSNFQINIWQELQKIPYGTTQSYSGIAASIGCSSASRAAANAVGNNHTAIVIPCHRVINKNGLIGGYAWGIKYKEWLINHEKIRAVR